MWSDVHGRSSYVNYFVRLTPVTNESLFHYFSIERSFKVVKLQFKVCYAQRQIGLHASYNTVLKKFLRLKMLVNLENVLLWG